ncbi:MAG: pilus assembly protein TadG-related protein, partial [Geminicoccaceae bacterium]
MGDQHGSVLPMMAALMLMAAGGAALAVDIGRAYAVKSDLQSAADSAALAAAIMLPDIAAARTAAQRAVSRSLPGLNVKVRSEDIA